MTFETKQQPEAPKPNNPTPNPATPDTQSATPAEQSGKNKPPEALATNTAEDVDFQKKVDEKTSFYEKKVEALKKRFHSGGSTGETKAEFIEARMINRLRIAAADKKNEFQSLAATQKAERQAMMLGSTEQSLVDIYSPYEKLIDYVKKMNIVSDADLVKLEALMSAVNKLKTNPVLEKMFFKVLNSETLDPKEMQSLVDQIKPADLSQKIEKIDPNVVFESSQVGAIIGVMSAPQRLQLVEMIFKSKPITESMPILESLISAGIINNLQIQELCSKHKIPEPQAGQLKAQLESGEISKKQQEYQQTLARLEAVNKGKTPENPVVKIVGTPLALAAAGFLGLATALINLKMNWNWKDIPGSIKAAGPYAALGTTAALGAAAATAYYVDPETYGKYKDKFVDFWSGPERLQAKTLGKKTELQGMLELELKKNPFLMEFMATQEDFPGGKKKTGFEVIQELVTEKLAKKQSIDFDYQEILAHSGPKQQTLLTKTYGMLGSKDINFKDSLRAVMAGMTALEFNTPPKVLALVADIKKQQGLA